MRSISSRGAVHHVFAFLIAIIIIVATVVLSMRLIGGFTRTGCEASTIRFLEEFRTNLDADAPFGSMDEFTLEAPCGAQRMCLVDARIFEAPQTFTGTPEIAILVREGVEKNLFVWTDESLESVYDKRVILTSPEQDPKTTETCITELGGTFTLQAQGYGRYVLLS